MQEKREGQPEKPVNALASRVPGMCRTNVELPKGLLKDIQRLADANERTRAAEMRVLLGEAVAARKKVERGA